MVQLHILIENYENASSVAESVSIGLMSAKITIIDLERLTMPRLIRIMMIGMISRYNVQILINVKRN